MTEKEKQQSGELYLANDKELVAERVKAKKLCVEFNAIEYNDYQKKTRLLDRLLALRGENTWIEANFFCDYGYNIIMGNNFYSNHNLVILDCAEVIFGDNVFIGPNCGFYTAGHPLDYRTRNQGYEYAKPIKVGSNVWIGGNVCVMPGVTIGDNVVIAGGSVVADDIPSGVMAAGNPCKPVRQLPADEIPDIPAPAEKAEEKAAPAEEKPAENAQPAQPKPKKKRRVIGVEEIKK